MSEKALKSAPIAARRLLAEYLHISALYIGHDVTKWCLLCLPERPSVRHAPLQPVRRRNTLLFLLRSALVVRLHVAPATVTF